MWRVTIKGILAHKVRFLLTGVAVILGVAFISGHARAHRDDQQDVRRAASRTSTTKTDAVVRAKAVFKGDFGTVRGRIDDSLIPEVRRTDGRRRGGRQHHRARAGGRQGQQGAQQRPGSRRRSASRGSTSQDLSPFHLVDVKGSGEPGAAAPNQVVIDKATVEKTGYRIGDARSR